MIPDERLEAAEAYTFDKFTHERKGPCLIARVGSELPNCHENDFCECEIKEAFLAGHAHAQVEIESLRVQLAVAVEGLERYSSRPFIDGPAKEVLVLIEVLKGKS